MGVPLKVSDTKLEPMMALVTSRINTAKGLQKAKKTGTPHCQRASIFWCGKNPAIIRLLRDADGINPAWVKRLRRQPAYAGKWFLSQSFKAASTRVCQPSPLALNCSGRVNPRRKNGLMLIRSAQRESSAVHARRPE
jgi:hypothetical protein